MSDERLREAERAWRATQSSEDEGAYLRELVRVGRLARDRLRAAAALGHAGAACALAESVDTLNWHLAFQALEPAAFVRAMVAIFDEIERNRESRLIDVATAARDWCQHPSALNQRILDEAARVVADQFRTATGLWAIWARFVHQVQLIVVHQPATNDSTTLPFLGGEDAVSEWIRGDETRFVVARDLVPWLLGRGDPLRDPK